jgi:hypothetical protein
MLLLAVLDIVGFAFTVIKTVLVAVQPDAKPVTV